MVMTNSFYRFHCLSCIIVMLKFLMTPILSVPFPIRRQPEQFRSQLATSTPLPKACVFPAMSGNIIHQRRKTTATITSVPNPCSGFSPFLMHVLPPKHSHIYERVCSATSNLALYNINSSGPQLQSSSHLSFTVCAC